MSRIETIQLEWFSVDEKLPEEFRTIYFKKQSRNLIVLGYMDANNWFIYHDTNDWCNLSEVIEWCYYPYNHELGHY